MYKLELALARAAEAAIVRRFSGTIRSSFIISTMSAAMMIDADEAAVVIAQFDPTEDWQIGLAAGARVEVVKVDAARTPRGEYSRARGAEKPAPALRTAGPRCGYRTAPRA